MTAHDNVITAMRELSDRASPQYFDDLFKESPELARLGCMMDFSLTQGTLSRETLVSALCLAYHLGKGDIEVLQKEKTGNPISPQSGE